MNEIGKEYGAALFMLAVEERAENGYKLAVDLVRLAFRENADLMEILRSPNIPFNERLSIIDKVFKSIEIARVIDFLKLLCEKGRITLLFDALDEFDSLLNAKKRVFTAKVKSAVALTSEQKSALIEKLKLKYKGEVKAEYTVDNQLIGGLIVEIDGEILDGSLSTRLKDVKEVMGK